MKLNGLLSVGDFARAAGDFLPDCVRGYVEGGTEDCRTLEANTRAFENVQFRPRGLVGVAERDQGVELFGQHYASPIGIAPMGVTTICRRHCDTALAEGARDSNIPFVLSGLSTTPMETLRESLEGFWYQGYLPGDTTVVGPLLDRLKQNGVSVLVVTIDTPVGANRENNQRAGFTIPFQPSWKLFWDGVRHPRWSFQVFGQTLLKDRRIPRFTNVTANPIGHRITENPPGGLRQGRDRLNWEHMAWIRERWQGPLVLKGVGHPADAERAAKEGMDGIIVSNHGGRQLDGAQASLAALPEAVAAVPADFPVMVDGGFRRGGDVLKAVALGARMVFLGRPMLYGATVGGVAGVRRIAEIMHNEIDCNMALLGCRTLAELDSSLLTQPR